MISHRSLMLAFSVFAGAAVYSSQAANVSLNFNGTDTFTPNFSSQTNGGAPGSGNFAYSATGGISDNGGSPGGGIIIPSAQDQTTVYNQSLNLTDGNVQTISAYVKYAGGGGGADKPMQLGFVNGATNEFNSNPGMQFLSARLLDNNSVEFQYRDSANTVASNNTGFSAGFTGGDWIRLTLTIQLTNATNGTVGFGFKVDDFGPLGTSASPVNLVTVANQSITNGSYAGTALSSYYGGFRSTVAETPQGFDNFTIVPEPASAAFVALGALGLAARRRRVA